MEWDVFCSRHYRVKNVFDLIGGLLLRGGGGGGRWPGRRSWRRLLRVLFFVALLNGEIEET